ncbi:hypothetical protein F5Y04DRAFT_255810 [Hypomontagnella monticulosa]|nr:hypothetical protein F5Y04DRAFT_255810 [Hypomontagnella monticulosa]
MSEKTIYLPPNFLFYPAATEKSPGSIQLGALISNIGDPKHAIGTLPPLDMAPYKMSIDTLDAGSMGHVDNSSSSFSANMFIKAVELLGAKLNLSVQNSNKLLSAMEEIKTEEFDPKDSYVKASLEQQAVKDWLNEKNALGLPKWPKRRVFMVCGILIAKPKGNSKVDISSNSNSGVSGEASVDGAGAQSPVGGGGNATFAKEFGLNFVPKSPFIYGFRLRECFLKKGKASSVPRTKGAKMHTGTEKTTESSGQTEEEEFEYVGVGQQDLDFDSLGDMEDDFEDPCTVDDEDCVMIMPKAT